MSHRCITQHLTHATDVLCNLHDLLHMTKHVIDPLYLKTIIFLSYISVRWPSQWVANRCPEGTQRDILGRGGLPLIDQGGCYAPSSISVFLGCRGHICCPHVMLLFLVPVSGTFLLLYSSDISLVIVPCNKVVPHCIPYGGPFPFYSLQP